MAAVKEHSLLETGMMQLRAGYGGTPVVPLWGAATEANIIFAEYVCDIVKYLCDNKKRTVVLRPNETTCAFVFENNVDVYSYLCVEIEKDEVFVTNHKGERC
jgi:hypothetical protein